jgi:hypothetical protein
VTTTSLILGFVTWKLTSVRKEVEELEASGVLFTIERDWFGVPGSARIPCAHNPRCDELYKRVLSLGIRENDIGAIESTN